MQSEPIRILIADDHPVVRQGLRAVLDTDAGLEVVAEVADGNSAVDTARELDPDVILMDLRMPEMDGVTASRRILENDDGACILVLTSFGGDRELFPALEAGALGFMLKDEPAEELIRAIRVVADGLTALSPRIAHRVVHHASSEPGAPAVDEPLTEREKEVLRELARGSSNDEIAEKLFISPATVRTHLGNLFAKLNLTRRTQAVLYALRHGIAELGEDLDTPPLRRSS